MSHPDQPTPDHNEPTTFLIDLENLTTTEYRFQNAPPEFVLRLQGGPAKPNPELHAPERKHITITFPPNTNPTPTYQYQPTPVKIQVLPQKVIQTYTPLHRFLSEELGKALEQVQTLKERLNASLRNEDPLVDRLTQAEQQIKQLQQQIPLPENFGDSLSSPPENNPPAVEVTAWRPPQFGLCPECLGRGHCHGSGCRYCHGIGIRQKTP